MALDIARSKLGMALAVVLAGIVSVNNASHLKKENSMEYIVSKIKSSRPAGIDPAFDCAWREAAYKFAPQIQPWIVTDPTKMKDLFVALQLDSLCQKVFVFPPMMLPEQADIRPQYTSRFEDRLTSTDTITFFVDPVKGNDSQPFSPDSGSISKPFRTIASAVEATRYVRSTAADMAAAVMLREGVYYLEETITLAAADSSLTIAAYNGENVVVSGGVHVSNITWKQPAPNSSTFVADLGNVELPRGVPALQYGNPFARTRAVLARYPNANPEVDLFPKGYITTPTNWSAPLYHGKPCDPKKQCGPSTTVTLPTPLSEWHGMYQNWTTGVGGACDVYDPPRSPWCSAQFYLERQFPEMHTRHPSGMSPGGSIAKNYASPYGAIVTAWRPGHWYTWMFEVESHVEGTKVDKWVSYTGQNNIYGLEPVPKEDTDKIKYLGTFKTETECWAACNASKVPCMDYTWHHTDFPQPTWAGGCYFTVGGVWNPTAQPGISSARGPHTDGGEFVFGAGGNQGGEGNEKAGEWFISNVQEELDSPGEFWFDPVPHLLYLIPNATAPPNDIVVPTLANLFEIVGSQAFPVTNVSITGITFTANRPTFMEPRTNPSGGDWALERMAAIFMEGTEFTEIMNNTFVRLDTNAVFLSGYNRNVSVVKNDFRWLGQNAIASWGRAVDNDGTNGEFPRYTLIEGNFIHEIGHIQKQSSFYFQAETAEATITNNICFNIPRAAINFNDGFGGGAELTQNLLFNTCRESSDHGAFNSWDRLPYYTTVRNGTPSTIPAFNNVHRNFIVANYAADGGCLDNDDGSSYYDIHHNFCVFGGHKSDFDGNMKYSRFNIHAYPSVYGDKCLGILAQKLPPKGYAEQYTDNICILANAGDPYLDVGGLVGAQCLTDDNSKQIFIDGLTVGNNTIFVPNGDALIECSPNKVDFKKFQSMGYDEQSTISGNMPSPTTIISWAETLLKPQ